jgi:hypothetical protein
VAVLPAFSPVQVGAILGGMPGAGQPPDIQWQQNPEAQDLNQCVASSHHDLPLENLLETGVRPLQPPN